MLERRDPPRALAASENVAGLGEAASAAAARVQAGGRLARVQTFARRPLSTLPSFTRRSRPGSLGSRRLSRSIAPVVAAFVAAAPPRAEQDAAGVAAAAPAVAVPSFSIEVTVAVEAELREELAAPEEPAAESEEIFPSARRRPPPPRSRRAPPTRRPAHRPQ